MNVRTKVRTLAMAAAIGVAIIGSPAGLALAAPNTTPQGQCELNGGVWDANKKACATKSCEHNGRNYSHGGQWHEYATTGHIRLRTKTYTCDGFTGRWIASLSAGSGQTEEPGVLSR